MVGLMDFRGEPSYLGRVPIIHYTHISCAFLYIGFSAYLTLIGRKYV